MTTIEEMEREINLEREDFEQGPVSKECIDERFHYWNSKGTEIINDSSKSHLKSWAEDVLKKYLEELENKRKTQG